MERAERAGPGSGRVLVRALVGLSGRYVHADGRYLHAELVRAGDDDAFVPAVPHPLAPVTFCEDSARSFPDLVPPLPEGA